MKKWDSVDEVLDFAIQNEQSAYEFYMGLSEKMEKAWMKKTFADFAREELGHKAKLEGIKAGHLMKAYETKVVMDLKIGDYLVAAEVSKDMDYQDALILAMEAEKKAFMLYSDLAKSCDDDANLKEIFLSLAQEEAKHKLRFEIEYDEFVLTEN